MIVLSSGFGTNSVSLIVECANRGIKIDLILFSDTAGERPYTYKYRDLMQDWLAANGMPEVITVQQVNKDGQNITLEGWCIEHKALPSIAYGFKSCSQKHKVAPQNKFMNNYQPAKDEWKAGRKITKFVGFDADEPQRAKDYSDDKYDVRFPLIEWDMGRDECIESIKKAGLPLPGKSACFFCPSSKAHEIRELQAMYPDLAKRALEMEANADLTSIKGLGRNWAWRDLLATDDMFGYDQHIELDCGCYDG